MAIGPLHAGLSMLSFHVPAFQPSSISTQLTILNMKLKVQIPRTQRTQVCWSSLLEYLLVSWRAYTWANFWNLSNSQAPEHCPLSPSTWTLGHINTVLGPRTTGLRRQYPSPTLEETFTLPEWASRVYLAQNSKLNQDLIYHDWNVRMGEAGYKVRKKEIEE